MKKYLTALYTAVGSITNLARRTATVGIVSQARSQSSSRLKGYLHLADQNRQLEESILELENQIKLRDRLLSIISHDTRAPLNSLKSLLHLLSGEHLAPGDLREISTHLNHQVDELSHFLENLLRWAKNHHDEIKPLKENLLLRQLVNETIELLSLLADKKGVRIHCFILENQMIYGDVEMIKVIMRNLISNAIKYCDANDNIYVQAHQMRSGVNISVRDTGRGITKEKLETLFQFSNSSASGTKDEIGTGLGLALCREFVEKLGGIIHASSVEGQGSCFEFTVPNAVKRFPIS